MPTLTTTPAYPLPNRICKVRASATTGGTAIRIWCTDAPAGSALRKKLDDSGAARVAFNPPTVDAGKDFDFTPDKGGGYVLVLDELARGTGFTGDYEGDPRGAPTESIVKSEPTTLRVADPVPFDIGFGGDTATVLIHVLADRVIQTLKDVHGVASPAIIATKSPRAKAAASTLAVRAAVAELAAFLPNNVDVPEPPLAAAVIGSFTSSVGSVVRNLARKYDAHLKLAASHETVDNDNVLTEDYTLSPVDSVTGQAEALTKMLDGIGRHIRNANPEAEENPGATNSADPVYHAEVGWAALPMAGVRPGNSPATIWPALAELWRVMVAHFGDDDAHEETDGVNDPSDPTRLLDLHIKFMTELASIDPTAGPTVNSAKLSFLAAGAKEP